MPAVFPGSNNAEPGTYVLTETISRGVAVPSGTRLPILIGEGAREETLIASAVGDGNDGLNSTYTSANGSDGRHFITSLSPLITNRTRLFKNGVELDLLEDAIDDSSFDNRFDARIDISNGQIELQTAQLVDQGGAYYSASGTNVGNGTVNGLTLLDPNAPTETWTIRVSSVRRDGYGNPIDGYARFIARGSVSGVILDGYGNQIAWQSNGTTNDNGILRFSISEGSETFREGDAFVVQVQGGVLLAGDSLRAIYIAESDLNEPEFFDSFTELTAKHGQVSLTNRISLGAQLLFANGAPGTFTLQAKPSIPRRISYILKESANGESGAEDLQFELPLNVVPDVDANINFFVTDPVTEVETQILPNKEAFYDSTITANPDLFHFGAGYDFSYTVILDDSVQKEGEDGVLTSVTGTTATLSSATVTFNLDDVSATRSVKIINSGAGNDGTYAVVSVSGGVVTITDPGGFSDETGVEFQVLDSTATSARILFTDDLALSLGQTLRATVVDTKDADFFDAGWVEAYAAAEKVDVDMVVPLPSQTISAIFQNGKVHVEKMSGIKQKRERILLIGAIAGLDPENVIGTSAAAVENIGVLEGIQGDDVTEILAGNIEDLTDYGVQNAFGDSFRIVFFYPDQIVVQVGADNQLIDGFFIAAAAAGHFAGVNNINTPLTNKRLSGFSILKDKLYSPLVRENILAAGVSLLQPVIGGGRVIWGKTTTISGFAEEEEISIVFIRDRIAKSMRTAFDPFIGVAESDTFLASLFARAISQLNAFVSARLITEYRNLEIKRDSSEPRQFNIVVQVQPAYPINWVYVRVGVGLL